MSRLSAPTAEWYYTLYWVFCYARIILFRIKRLQSRIHSQLRVYVLNLRGLSSINAEILYYGANERGDGERICEIKKTKQKPDRRCLLKIKSTANSIETVKKILTKKKNAVQ